MSAIPEKVIAQHTAVLGKTGGGKTTTAKLIVEQVVADGSRVCILDPNKRDWWGLTSSADGKRPGLPFSILGGPRGHVPLHSGAGKALAEVVASGALPLSILDMADFNPGGQVQFFSDFAPTLLRKMRGVLYLVIEESHLFAPKERSGFGAENMSIHWAKTLATAGRTKGIRLIVLSQRTQALHNAVLGSCDTLIAHRFTAPADQKPVVDWLKANVEPEIARQVAGSLSSLKTGEAWLCSGEAKLFERKHFPRAATYDNTKTPSNDLAAIDVKTAPVDNDHLRAIIGSAVAEAEAKDPKKLLTRIATLELELKGAAGKADGEALQKSYADGYRQGQHEMQTTLRVARERLDGMSHALVKLSEDVGRPLPPYPEHPTPNTQPIQQSKPTLSSLRGMAPDALRGEESQAYVNRVRSGGEPTVIGNSGKRRMLIALAQNPRGLTYRKLAILTEISRKGGTWRTYMGELRSKGWVNSGEPVSITAAGIEALGAYDPLPTGKELIAHWQRNLGNSGKRKIFDIVVSVYPNSISKADLSRRSEISTDGGTWRTYMGELRSLELITGSGELRASDDLF